MKIDLPFQKKIAHIHLFAILMYAGACTFLSDSISIGRSKTHKTFKGLKDKW